MSALIPKQKDEAADVFSAVLILSDGFLFTKPFRTVSTSAASDSFPSDLKGLREF